MCCLLSVLQTESDALHCFGEGSGVVIVRVVRLSWGSDQMHALEESWACVAFVSSVVEAGVTLCASPVVDASTSQGFIVSLFLISVIRRTVKNVRKDQQRRRSALVSRCGDSLAFLFLGHWLFRVVQCRR